MKIALVATHKERYFETLVRSLKKEGLSYDILGLGQKWTGFMMKYDLMIEWLKLQTPNAIVMHLDAFDSIIIGHKDAAIDKFKNSGHNVLFSRPPISNSYFFHILGMYLGWRVFGTPPWRYEEHMNTGMYIGYAGVLLNLLQEVKQLCDTNDDERCMNMKTQIRRKYN